MTKVLSRELNTYDNNYYEETRLRGNQRLEIGGGVKNRQAGDIVQKGEYKMSGFAWSRTKIRHTTGIISPFIYWDVEDGTSANYK